MFVAMQVFLGRPLLLLPPSGSHCIATLAGLCGEKRSGRFSVGWPGSGNVGITMQELQCIVVVVVVVKFDRLI